MPEPVNTSSAVSKLNEFYEMPRMLIVFVVQSAAFDCPGYEAPVALDLGTPTFDAPADLQSLIKSTPPRNWITKVGFKILCRAPPGCKSVTQNPVTDASYSGSLTFTRIDSDLLEWSSRSGQIGLNSKV